MPFFIQPQDWVNPAASPKVPIPKVTIQELFEKQAGHSPDRIALVGEGEEISYAEVNRRANNLARKLRQAGVGPDTVVGLLASRSPRLLIGMLGILKAGGAYLPVDPEYPKERVAFMLRDSGTQVLAADTGLIGSEMFPGTIIDLCDACSGPEDEQNLPPQSEPHHLAYVIYTSGSTGRPKGVMIEHRSVVNLIEGISSRIDFSPGRTIVAQTTMSFDIFVLESLLPLVRGMKVAVAGRAAHLSHRVLNETLLRHRVDMMQITPTRMRQALQSGASLDGIKNLKTILLGGEVLSADLVKQLRRITSARLYNMYGPTEATVWSTLQDMTDDEAVTIGTPIANTRVYIVGPADDLLPAESIGELCIAGEGVARGYVNRPELERRKFADDPLVPGARMYRTGDSARCNREHRLELFGRLDDLVKINGNTIHLGEIEQVLLESGLVSEAAIDALETKSGGRSLVAFYAASRNVSVEEFISVLVAKLPRAYIPVQYLRIERMPVLPNGKMDRHALAALKEGKFIDGR